MTIMIHPQNHLSVITLDGNKTQSFLQGQVTCDMNAITNAGDYSLSACCDPKGRMVANFWILKSETNYLLIVPTSMVEIIISHLNKYAIFSKVTLTSDLAYHIYTADNISKNALQDTLSAANHIISLPNKKRHLVLSQNLLSETTSADTDHTQWLTQNIKDQFALLSPSTSLLFTPQMIDLEKQGGVSFEKGCYVGQEIVARTQHLGKLKRHLHHLTFSSTTPKNAGDSLLNNKNEKIGTIVNAVCNQNQVDALAVIEDRALSDIQAQLAAPSGDGETSGLRD